MDQPLNICLISAYDFAVPGGVNNHVSKLAKQFRKLGHNVRIIAPCSDAERINDPAFMPMGKPVPIPSGGSVARVSVSLWLRPRIKQFLDEGAFDIIHLHEPFSSAVNLNAISLSQTTNIGTFHSYKGTRLYPLGGKRLLMPYFQRLDGRIAVSKPAMDFVSHYLPGDYVIIPNGLEVDEFTGDHIQPFPQYKDGKINLLFFSRLEKRKGLRYLLAAYSRLKWKYPLMRLLVAGYGKPDADSLHIIGERALTDVIFLGSVSEPDKARYFRTADIYCAPNTGGESFGIILLEAMAAGTPIVASAIEGFSGVITQGRDGLLVPAKSDEALATAIETLIKAPSLRNALVQAGRETVEKYRWSHVAVQVLEYYQTVQNIRASSGMTFRRPVHRII